MIKYIYLKLGRTWKVQSGFSYLELIVLIAILGLLTGGLVINFRQAEKKKSVALAADSVTNAIRLTQSYSLSGKQIPSTATRILNSATPADCTAGSKAAADYRIVFSGNSPTYTIYASDKCNDVWTIESGNLPPKTLIKPNSTVIDVSQFNDIQLLFTPPFARMTVANTATISSTTAFRTFVSAQIFVQNNDPAFTKRVRVDAISGKIGVQ